MKLFNRNFLIGFCTGAALGMAVSLVVHQFLAPSGLDPAKIAKIMLPPPFPLRGSADYTWTVRGLHGKALLMSELRGRVVFLNFWATWCVPCIAEMPSIQRLYEQVKDDAVFVCVSPEEASVVNRFVEENGYRIPMYTFEGSPPAVFQVEGYPKTLIIGPDGRIAFAHTGTALWDDSSSVAFIRHLSSSATTLGPRDSSSR